MKSEIGIRVQECLDDPKNQKSVNEIVLKMGRVLAKKRALENQQPVMVFDGRIWIGNYSFASNRQFLENNQIKAVASCLELALPLYLPNITYRRFQLKDSADERFQTTAQQFINWVQICQGNIYVHCFSGHSRSVALLLALIMYKDGKSYDEALDLLRQSYPKANPNTYFESVLRKMILKPPENNLLDADFQQAPKSPLKSPSLEAGSPGKSNKEINLLQIEGQDLVKVDETSQNLLGEFVPTLLTQGNSIKIENNNTNNELDIFESQPPEIKKQQSTNRIQLLDFNQQIKLDKGEDPTTSQKKQPVEQQNLLGFQPIQQHSQSLARESEQTTITQTTQQIKVQTLNLLDDVPKVEVKAENEETFADNTDFTQKKVKKHKKKR